MKKLIVFLFCLSTSTLFAQNVIQLKITVNPELTVLSDVTANADSIPHGRHLIIYKNKTIVRGTVNDGLMDGVWTIFYMNGQQKMKGRYQMGQPHGEWIYWSKTGEVQAKFQFSKGKRIGHWQGYYSNRAKAIDIIFNPKGAPEQCIQYYQDEIIALNHEYKYVKKDTLTKLSYYFKNYSIFHYEQLKNGTRHGLVSTYHSNGLVWDSYKFNHGLLANVLDGYSSGGVPRKNTNFRNGNGIVNKYYSNGNRYSQTNYQNGLKQDSITIYDLGGKIGGAGRFEKGLPIGKWDIYSKFHKHIFDLEVQDERDFVLMRIYTSTAPKERQTGFLLHGYKHGIWKKYNAYGELVSEKSFRQGFLNGISKRYESNKVMSEFHYTNDNKDGDFTYFNSFGEINIQETFETESTLDTNWFKPPIKNWISVSNEASETHQKYLWFYPSLPGMEIVKAEKGFMAKQEGVFKIQRGIPYDYWPELIPANFMGGALAEKQYIRNYLTIPVASLNHHVNGRVMVRYKVDQIGLISEITLLKTLGFGLDEVAINLVKSFPPLNPATYNGIPIPSYIVREFDFSF